ncbi:MAG: hypothetical protein K0R65_1508 [Crocinitomicaceae bacterium]|jgi:hypothetical protein|nr:hypothetical protein [Crocinitomicaceae bacterium]
MKEKTHRLTLEQANRLSKLPCKCLQQEFPNKLGQVLNDSTELLRPQTLHPVFYGCFDWHSSVHGHWLLVNLVKKFPALENREQIIALLDEQFDAAKIRQEMAFFKVKNNESFERTYGWAWILKLQEELESWDDPKARRWAENLSPLSDLLIEKYMVFLPKLVYPIRTGEHPNTAFGLSLAYDYAGQKKDEKFKTAIREAAKRFYEKDINYAFAYEPGGYDFLSPGLQEIDLMRKVLPKGEFMSWLKKFHPMIFDPEFDLEPGKILDRTDGKLVHLDGLNFSRAWCLYDLAKSDEKLAHLTKLAETHLNYSLPNIVDGDYMGEHWLASFACYALGKQ